MTIDNSGSANSIDASIIRVTDLQNDYILLKGATSSSFCPLNSFYILIHMDTVGRELD